MNVRLLRNLPAVLAMTIALPLGAQQLGNDRGARHEEPRVHEATGVIERIDARNRLLTLAHDPVPSLRWPAMSMDFALEDGWSAVGVRPGDKVSFRFTQRGRDYVVVALDKMEVTASRDSPRASRERTKSHKGMAAHGGHDMRHGGHSMEGMHSMGDMCGGMMSGKSIWRDVLDGLLGRRGP